MHEMTMPDIPRILHGRPLSPGLAEGTTHVHGSTPPDGDAPVSIDTKDIDQECHHLEHSIGVITEDLLALATRVEKEMDASLAAIFEAHRQMLNDPVLKKELQAEIQGNLVSAGSAVKTVFRRWERRFLKMESRMSQQKGSDMRDISNRLSNALAGIHVHPLEQIAPGCVLVAATLLASDTVFLSKCSAAAVLLGHGHTGSHAALFLRSMGMPCIANIPDILGTIPSGIRVLVDADRGELVLCPETTQETAFQNLIGNRQKLLGVARKNAKKPAITLDGITIPVFANVATRHDVEIAMQNGADGIGLYRTEQTYMGRTKPPGANELLEEMQRTLEPAKGKLVNVRLLDGGGDKPLPFMGFQLETNPALGARGIRMQIAYPRLLEVQLEAILKLAADFAVCILIPMVTLPQDVVVVREALDRMGAKRGTPACPGLGAMIETPAAALSLARIAPHVEFVSFGTNDLTQYAFASDRENIAVEQYYNDSDDIIFRLLQLAHDDVPRMPLSLCGELAGRATHITRLLRCGIRTLSVAPPLIPFLKAAVRAVRIQQETKAMHHAV